MTDDNEMRSIMQELAGVRRREEELTKTLSTYEPIITAIKALTQSAVDSESRTLLEKLAVCQDMLKQQEEETNTVKEMQQNYGISLGHLKSENHELLAQLNNKKEQEKELLNLRSELESLRAKHQQNFLKIQAELQKVREERNLAQDQLAQYKEFIKQTGQNFQNFVVQVPTCELPVSPIIQTQPEYEQGGSQPKRAYLGKRN